VITHIDNEPVQGLSLAEAVERMRGPVDTSIALTLRRAGQEEAIDVSLARAVITISPVRWHSEGDIGYIRITAFNEQTESNLEQAVEELDSEIGADMKGVVVDLRNNPGGLLDQAVAVADAFLEQGEIVSTRGRKTDSVQRFNARSGDITHGLPMVVLINGGSASASEIVAGALKDHGRAIVMGTRSFGKGSVQTIMPLPGHGAIRLTTARYYTPAGTSIQAKGIVPDIEVVQARVEAIDQGMSRREADLRNRLENDQGEASASGADEVSSDGQDQGQGSAEEEDYQLARALDLLRGVAMFSGRTVQ
jgi:carboxyl-terminal processing protease